MCTIMTTYDRDKPSADAPLTFPSLDDSPLWADDFKAAAEAVVDETPPLFIIRDKYPRIAKAIELMWGAPEMDSYFSQLIVNERNDRAGFPREVMAAILKLSADHTQRFKFDQKKTFSDSWGADRFHRYAFKK
jgi:hypothetical protein